MNLVGTRQVSYVHSLSMSNHCPEIVSLSGSIMNIALNDPSSMYMYMWVYPVCMWLSRDYHVLYVFELRA